MSIEKKKIMILNRIDKMIGYYEKLEFLNGQYLRAVTAEEEDLIMGMLEQLKFYSK